MPDQPREDAIKEAAARLRRAAAALTSVSNGIDEISQFDAGVEAEAIAAAIAAEKSALALLKVADGISYRHGWQDDAFAVFEQAVDELREAGRKKQGALSVQKRAYKIAADHGMGHILEYITIDNVRAWIKTAGD